jgi:hypothetical protein
MNEIKRKLALLTRLPTETDFNQLKQRIEMIENINNNFKRRMDDFDKRLKTIDIRPAGVTNNISVEHLNSEHS